MAIYSRQCYRFLGKLMKDHVVLLSSVRTNRFNASEQPTTFFFMLAYSLTDYKKGGGYQVIHMFLYICYALSFMNGLKNIYCRQENTTSFLFF